LQSIFGSWSEYTKNEREKEKDAGEEKKARESSNEMRKTYRFLVIRFKKKKKTANEKGDEMVCLEIVPF
jgi:DNA-binding ferritin-like protein